jgi:hypothetical protein
MHRPSRIEIEGTDGQRATLRDQKPMSDSQLTRALAGSGLTPADWYEILNKKVFFWATKDRLTRMMGAYGNDLHTVLTVHTEEFLKRYGALVELCHMNSGCTRPFAHARSTDIFRPVGQYSRPNIAEIAVPDGVPDIGDLVVDVRDIRHSDLTNNIDGLPVNV